MTDNQTILIGITGASASGKSLLANTIVNELGTDQVVVMHEDSYYRNQDHMTMEERTKTNYDHPASMDHDLLFEHLLELQAGRPIKVPVYDHAQHTRAKETNAVGGHTIVVIEGILLFADPRIRDIMNIRIFMDTPLDICLVRRIRRDVIERARTFESVLEQYEETVRPMYLQFIEPAKVYADIIVPRGGENRIATDMIQAKMKELLGYIG